MKMMMMLMLMTHTNILSGVNKLGLFRMFLNVPQVWNKVFLYGQRVCCLFYINVPKFHIYTRESGIGTYLTK